MDIQTIKETRNKAGELMFKTVQLTNKVAKRGLDFDSINDLYKELLKKYDASAISIIGKPMDGGLVTLTKAGDEKKKRGDDVTLKSSKHTGDDLKHVDESYYSSLPKRVRDALQGRFYSVQITIKL